MTDWYPDEELRELASLRNGAPERQALVLRLASAAEAERDYWTDFLRLTDRLYAASARVEPPAGLEERLLLIADEQPMAAPRWKQVLRNSLNWKSVAACLLIVLAARNLAVWWSSLPPEKPLLASNVAAVISKDAVKFTDSNRALDVTGGDAGQVQTALASRGLPFPVMVLHPKVKLDLFGGGTCDLDGTPAAYTRWQSNGQNYTVFQFDGSKMGVPSDFRATSQTPSALWHDSRHYHVVIWPGKVGGCTWVVVMESDGAQDVFSGLLY